MVLRRSAAAGGGCLIDLGVHVVDLLRAVTGDDIVAVSAVLQRPGGRRRDRRPASSFACDGGAIGSIHASWSRRSGPDHQLTVVGTEGTLHLDSRTPLTLADRTGERERVELPDTTSSPLEELLAAIARRAARPTVTAADGRAAVAVVEAAYQARPRRARC